MLHVHTDPAFALHEGPCLHLGGPVHGRDVARVLAQRVRRDPGDLRAHVLRIQLLVAARGRRRLHGALVDLYIALEGGGLALRERLLAAATPLFSRRQRAFFADYRKRPLPARQPMPGLRGSVLCEGYEGVAELVVADSLQAGYSSALEEALSCIEYGQLAQAQQVLEAALLENPEDAAVCHELVNLYAHTGDEMAVVDLCSRLIEHDQLPPDAIIELLGDG